MRIEHKITQLPTSRHNATCVASTKRRWRGPATILTTTYDDGAMHDTEFDYTPDATVESLLALIRARRHA